MASYQRNSALLHVDVYPTEFRGDIPGCLFSSTCFQDKGNEDKSGEMKNISVEGMSVLHVNSQTSPIRIRDLGTNVTGVFPKIRSYTQTDSSLESSKLLLLLLFVCLFLTYFFLFSSSYCPISSNLRYHKSYPLSFLSPPPLQRITSIFHWELLLSKYHLFNRKGV